MLGFHGPPGKLGEDCNVHVHFMDFDIRVVWQNLDGISHGMALFGEIGRTALFICTLNIFTW